MKLAVLNNPINFFWHEQNQKLVASRFFMSEHGDFFSDIWDLKVKIGGGITSIDFSWFDSPAFQLDGIAIYTKGEHEYSLSCKEFAKLTCIIVLSDMGAYAVLPTYKMMLHIFSFIKGNNISILSQNVLHDFWASFLGRSVNVHGFFNRVSMPSYRAAIGPVSLPKIRNQLKALGVRGVIDTKVTPKKIGKSLDEVCRARFFTP